MKRAVRVSRMNYRSISHVSDPAAGNPGITPTQRTFAIQVDQAIKNVEGWLLNVHKDAQQLVPLFNRPALIQPSTLDILDDLANQALYTFAGKIDPINGNVQEGVV